jgi:photosystem II stability/assembly factor-like uncharacterized protein
VHHRSVLRTLAAGAAALVATALFAGSATATPTAATPTTATTAASGRAPVPEGFRAQSLTWASPARGWALGTATCDGQPCTSVIRTSDGGRTWSSAGVVDAPIAPPGEPGLTDLDFADARHGWAYGPSLQRTADGGHSWSPAPLPGGGQQVIALVAEAGVVYMVVSPCELGQPPYECTNPPTLWRAPAAAAAAGRSGAWRRVDVALPVGASAILAAHGRAAYVVGQLPPPTPDAFYATTDGRTWSARPTPCDKEGNGDVLADVAPTSRTDVALLCVGNAGFSKASKAVFRSTDGARTFTPAGITPEWGILSELAATPGGTLAVASTSSGSWIYLNDTGADAWTTSVEQGDGGAGWNDLTFTSEDVGWAVYSPVAGFPGEGTLLRTADGGRTWTPAALV